MVKTIGARTIIYTVILLVAIAGFISVYVLQQNINNLILAVFHLSF